MTSSVPHTKIRNGIYHYNRRIPANILQDGEAMHLFFLPGRYDEFFTDGKLCRGSLKTRDRHEAMSKAADVSEEFQRRLNAASSVDAGAVTQSASIPRRPVITEQFERHVLATVYRSSVAPYEQLEQRAFANPLATPDFERTVDRIEADPEYFRKNLFGEDPASVKQELDDFLARRNLKVDPDSADYGKLFQTVRKALRLAQDSVQSILTNEAHTEPSSSDLQKGLEELRQGGDITPRAVFDDMSSRKAPSPTWREKCEKALSVFEEIIGAQRTIASITKQDAKRFQELLQQVPANQQQRFPGLNALEAIAANDQREQPVQRLSPKTVSAGYVAPIRAIFNEAVEQEYVEISPFERLPRMANKGARSPRRAFSEQELSTVFSQPVFIGCKDRDRPYGRNADGKLLINDHRFWVPLMALYTGARVSELGGLKVSDVIRGGRYPYIQIRENEFRSIKSDNARRNIPLPKEFTSLGFFEYLKAVDAKKSTRLFPDWEKRNKGTTDLATFSEAKWLVNFRRHLKRLLVDDDNALETTFHSFRKNYKQALKNRAVPAAYIDEVLGHEKSQMDAIYANEIISADITGPHIDKLSYPPLKKLALALKRP